MMPFDWLLFADKYRRTNQMSRTDPKLYEECRHSVFDWQINDENSKAALGMKPGFVCRN